MKRRILVALLTNAGRSVLGGLGLALALLSLVMWPRSYFYEDFTATEVGPNTWAANGHHSFAGVWSYEIVEPEWMPNDGAVRLVSRRRSEPQHAGPWLPWLRSYKVDPDLSLEVPYYLILLAGCIAIRVALIPSQGGNGPSIFPRANVSALLVATTAVAVIIAVSISSRLGPGYKAIAFEISGLLLFACVTLRRARSSHGVAAWGYQALALACLVGVSGLLLFSWHVAHADNSPAHDSTTTPAKGQ